LLADQLFRLFQVRPVLEVEHGDAQPGDRGGLGRFEAGQAAGRRLDRGGDAPDDIIRLAARRLGDDSDQREVDVRDQFLIDAGHAVDAVAQNEHDGDDDKPRLAIGEIGEPGNGAAHGQASGGDGRHGRAVTASRLWESTPTITGRLLSTIKMNMSSCSCQDARNALQ
jgi:hypothetical protein